MSGPSIFAANLTSLLVKGQLGSNRLSRIEQNSLSLGRPILICNDLTPCALATSFAVYLALFVATVVTSPNSVVADREDQSE